MTFPWETVPGVPVDFVCKHCGQVQPQHQGRLIICTCPGALKEQVEERQRMETWRRQQEEAQKPKRRR